MHFPHNCRLISHDLTQNSHTLGGNYGSFNRQTRLKQHDLRENKACLARFHTNSATFLDRKSKNRQLFLGQYFQNCKLFSFACFIGHGLAQEQQQQPTATTNARAVGPRLLLMLFQRKTFLFNKSKSSNNSLDHS